MNQPLVDVTGARQRRARARRQRRLRIAGIALGVLLLVAIPVWVVYASPGLAVREVRVEGHALVSPEDVVAAADVPLGRPLANLDTDAIEARVRDHEPAVAEAHATRSWPSTLIIEVREWAPVLTVQLPDSWVWISAQGQSFHTSTDRPEGVLVARGALADEGVLTTLAAVAAALPDEVRAEAAHIDAATVDSVTITLEDRRRIVWGSTEDAELKAAVLVPLLTVRAREYDVSAPTHPTTR